MKRLQRVRYRQVLDLYLFGQTYGGKMDADYLRRETEKLDIGPMRERVEQLAAYWFANKPGAADKELRELEAFCFLSGSYGGYLSQRICLMRKKQKNESGVGWKLQYFWHRLFPPFAILCMRYPKLKTAPWPLPYFWLCRLFDFSYWKNNFHREMATLQQVEQEKTSRSVRVLVFQTSAAGADKKKPAAIIQRASGKDLILRNRQRGSRG